MSEYIQLSLDLETWKIIPGYEDYEISDKGRLRRITARHLPDGRVHRGWGIVGKILHPAINADGYLKAALTSNGKYKKESVHRMVMRAFVGLCPDGMQVNHINGIRTDNRLENLEYVTPKENKDHGCHILEHGIGEQVHTAKLTEKQVGEIRVRLKNGETPTGLSRIYNVSPGAISAIKHRRSWKHVD